MKELVCIAPAEFWPVLRSGLVPCGYNVRFFLRQEEQITTAGQTKSRNDPYQLQALVGRLRKKADAILLVVPRNRSPRSVAPGPLIGDLPLGLVFANRPDDLQAWLEAVAHVPQNQLWAVLAMWKRSYMTMGRRFTRWLRGSNPHHVEGWYADNVTRDELIKKMAQGPLVAIYLGHGRPRGLTGYGGIRWYHFVENEQRQPCGVFICFACDTLKRTYGVFPFGCRLVDNGVVSAYFGAVEPLLVDANTRLAYHMGELFENHAACDLATLIRKMQQRLQDKPEQQSTWKAFNDYRIIGNPLQPLM